MKVPLRFVIRVGNYFSTKSCWLALTAL